jgi:hypothetical protein
MASVLDYVGTWYSTVCSGGIPYRRFVATQPRTQTCHRNLSEDEIEKHHKIHAALQHFMKMIQTDLMQPDFVQPPRSISEFIKPSMERNASFQTLATATTAVSDITDESVLYAQAHVQFSKRIRISQIMHLAEYTQEEMEATWYQEKDFARISKICIKTVHKMEKRRRRSLKNREIESRGLEGHTTTGIISKMENEQEHQSCQGIYDDEAMAESYESISSSCALWARKVALSDQRDAEDYFPVNGV